MKSWLNPLRCGLALAALGIMCRVNTGSAGELSTSAPRPTALSRNPFVWDAMLKESKVEGMGKLVSFRFWVTNSSSTNASILLTETSCDCTVAQLPSQPWLFKAGESASLETKLNITGKFGRLTNWIGVLTSHGPQRLTVIADIPFTPAPFNTSARERDRMIAQADRQAVFRDGCAACHALPTLGRMGEPLFATACAICHISDHRAAMVPDLASLKQATNSVYWRDWIMHGKAGSLMPAFAKSEGGMLDTNQIESLVEYLVKVYPFKSGSSATHRANSPAANPTPAARQ